MLSRLYIKNIGLIKECGMAFCSGLTSITGETGAGKSMFIDSLSLALGARAENGLIRHGEKQGTVEASFGGSDGASFPLKLQNIFFDLGIDLDDEIILRRVINKDKSRAFVNGVRVNQSQLKEIGDCLIDIHGQYDHQLLLKSNAHTLMLDNFGKLDKETKSVKISYETWKEINNQLVVARESIKNREDEEFLLKGYLEELENLSPTEGEEEALISERKTLMNSEKLIESFTTARDSLNEDVDIAARIGAAENALNNIGDTNSEIAEIYNRVASLNVEFCDILSDIDRLGNVFEPDPNRLIVVDERLFSLKDCARKHNCSVDNLPKIAEELLAKLNGLDNLQHNIEELETKLKTSREIYDKACASLTKQRKKVADNISIKVEKALNSLHMAGTKFKAALNEVGYDDRSETGAEKIEFMVATNAGSPLAPLVKIASGGEVSRLMLALKQVFYTEMEPTTLVFDEVDTGVGGKVADSMGEAMKNLAGKHQVFSITHLPQVAAKGDNHLRIEKFAKDNSTETVVTSLENNDRLDEVARMLSGKEITKESLKAAQQLLNVA